MKSLVPRIGFGIALLTVSFTFSVPVHAQTAGMRLHISKNWAGYAASGQEYTGIFGSWYVPRSNSIEPSIAADAAWIGIGGVETADLIQVGTQAIVNKGVPTYNAWYELLPDTQTLIPLSINPGDLISASIKETSRDIWRITISDITTGQSYQIDVRYHSSYSSAEWIVERPLAVTGTTTRYLPLSNFGTLTFRDAYAIVNGQQQSVGAAGSEKLVLDSGAANLRILAAPVINAQTFMDAFSVAFISKEESDAYVRGLKRDYTILPKETNAPSVRVEQTATSYSIQYQFTKQR